MSTLLEDRLTAALVARADLVHAEDLHHLALPQPQPAWRRGRRPAVAVLAAAACIAVLVVLVSRLGGAGDHEPLPPVHSVKLPSDNRERLPSGPYAFPKQPLTDRLVGDVDGDGRPDTIRAGGDTITVTLAAHPGAPVTVREESLVGLVGLIRTDGPGLAIVDSAAVLGNGDAWTVIEYRDGTLHRLADSHGVFAPGYGVSWISAGGVLMTGRLDPMQHGARALAVDVSRLEPRAGHLRTASLGHWCWDVVTQPTPAPCPAGVDDAFDPGPHGSLPRLLPELDTGVQVASPLNTWHRGATSLHLAEDPTRRVTGFGQVYDLVGTVDGHHVSAPVGAGPQLYTRWLDLGSGVPGLVVSRDAQVGSSWTFLVYVDGRLVVAPVRSNLVPGWTSYHSWIGPDRQAFTRVTHGTVGHDELYRWQVTDSSGTAVVPVDLGAVCIDDYWGTYGECRGSP